MASSSWGGASTQPWAMRPSSDASQFTCPLKDAMLPPLLCGLTERPSASPLQCLRQRATGTCASCSVSKLTRPRSSSRSSPLSEPGSWAVCRTEPGEQRPRFLAHILAGGNGQRPPGRPAAQGLKGAGQRGGHVHVSLLGGHGQRGAQWPLPHSQSLGIRALSQRSLPPRGPGSPVPASRASRLVSGAGSDWWSPG